MARKIVFLKKTVSKTDYSILYLFWLDVPADQQKRRANSGFKSAFADATDEEIAALQAGEVLEIVDTAYFAEEDGKEDVQRYLARRFKSQQAAVTDSPEFSVYGTSWDGSVWTAPK